MAQKPYVVIDSEILSSSIWSEEPHVKLVWLTLLILCDTEGYVGAAAPGIARAAGVSLEQAKEAIERLQQPDPESRTKTNEGRRLEPAERGWHILNFLEHLDRLSTERKNARERMRRHRERKKAQANSNGDETPGDAGYVTRVAGSREEGVGNRDVRKRPSPVPASVGGESMREGGSTKIDLRHVVSTAPANPLMVDREKSEKELLNLVAREAELTDRDPVEVMVEVAKYHGARTMKVNPATMTDDRLLNTIVDARSRVKALEARDAKRRAV